MLQTLSCRMDIAAKYGADAAIFINNIVYWTLKNQAENRNYHDGRYWTFGTVTGFAKLYPLWSEPQIKRIIAKCRDAGILLVGDFNEDRRDRTRWYSPSDEILALYDDGIDVPSKVRNRKMQSTESSVTSDEIGKCIYSKQVATKVDIPPIVPQGTTGTDSDVLFDRFWAAYPKKKAKPAARKAWRKLAPDMALCRTMAKALEAQKRSVDWNKDNGQYIPYPATWLNGRRWEDDPGPAYTPSDRPEIPPDDDRRGRYL